MYGSSVGIWVRFNIMGFLTVVRLNNYLNYELIKHLFLFDWIIILCIQNMFNNAILILIPPHI